MTFKGLEAIKMMPGTQLALLLVGIVTLGMVSVSLSVHLLVEPIQRAATNEILHTLSENQENINRTVTAVQINTRQNDRNLGFINESIAGSTATVENQKVIIEYLKAVILQNNQSLAQGQIIANLTNFLRQNFNETYVQQEAERGEQLKEILDRLENITK
jgi:hypothetical protein